MDPVTIALLVILLAIPVALFLNNRKKAMEMAKIIDQFPGDKRYPVIGTQWSIIKAGRENYMEVHRARNKKYGPTYRNWVGNIPQIVTWKPEHVQILLNNKNNINKSELYRFFKTFIFEGVFSSSGEMWKRDRKLLTPAFHLKMLETYTPIFNKRGKKLVDRFMENANTDKYVDVIPFCIRFAFDVMCEAAADYKPNSLEGENLYYLDAMMELFEHCYVRIFNPLIHNNLLFSLSKTGKAFNKCNNIVQTLVQKIIDERKQRLENVANNNDEIQEDDSMEKCKKVMLDIVLEAFGTNEERDEQWIRSQVLSMVFAGTDTTSLSIAWSLYALAVNPEVQEKVYDEILDTFHDDLDRDVTFRDINSMEYLDRTIKEVLRLYTVGPAMSRRLDEPITLDGVTLPAGCAVNIQILELHHDPNIYPDPEKFDPDRFLPENRSKRHPYSYIPFCAGHRNCIGQKFAHKNLRIALVHILRKFKVTALTPPEKLELDMDVTLKPKGGMPLRFEKRV